jgi:CHAD domain-containing protein
LGAMRRDPIELVLPPSLDTARAVELLGERLTLQPGRASTEDRVLLDSFDGRLRGEGLRAEAANGELALFEPGAPVRRVSVRRGANRYLVEDLPDGVVRDRLAPVLGPRALLPRARVRISVLPLAMIDGDEKTVARLTVVRPEVVGAGGLSPRLLVRPVLGYDKAYKQVVRTLRDSLGFDAADVSLFDAAVRASGGKPGGINSKPKVELDGAARSDTAAGLVLGALADIAAANLQGAIDDLDSEFLHDLRVSIRRARSVLREMKGVHPVAARAHLREELKWAQSVTGPVRDLDVQLLGWEALTRGLARPGDLEALRAVLARRRDAEQVKLRRALRSKRFAAMLDAWRALASTPPPVDEDPERPEAAAPIRELAGRRIRKVRRAMLRDGRAISDDSPPEALHDLRKRGKELRYLLELFGAPFDQSRVKPLVSELKGLQDVLGRFQDGTAHVAFLRGLAEELAGEPSGPAALMALGSVLDAVEADQRTARGEFAEAFAAFAAAKRP